MNAPLPRPRGWPAEIRDRRIGCLELLDFFIARAERHNPALNIVVAWQIETARERARAADAALAKGEIWGPLHGVPMTVKESFNVAGLPTTWGNPVWKNNIATGNAVLVDRLLGAGAVIYGKTNVPLMLQDSQSYNKVYGTTNNPWDKALRSGRLVGRRGGGAGGRVQRARGRQRHCRLAAQPGALLRRLWPQAELAV